MEITREIAHDIAIKLDVCDPIILNKLGKCLQAGVYLLREYIDGEKPEDLAEALEQFNLYHRAVASAFKG